MQAKQTAATTSSTQTTGGIKRTLNLTSLTVNAMALIAPGAFLWTTFQLQAAQMKRSASTAGEMWTGLWPPSFWLFSLPSLYGELSDIYPRAGSGSSYYFAEACAVGKRKGASPAIRAYCQIRHRLDFPSILLDISGYHGCLFGNFDRIYFQLVRG